MRKMELNIGIEILIKDYLELGSAKRVAIKHGLTIHAATMALSDAKALRSKSEAASIRNKSYPEIFNYERTEEHRKNLSEIAKNRTGDKNPFFGKKHNDESKKKMSSDAKKRTGKRNPNYKDGKYVRRPRDFKIAEFSKVRNFAFNRDKYTCHFCKNVGGHLHAHHILPYWVKPEAFLDTDNLITVCTNCHFEKAHLSNWHHFDVSLVSEALIVKYSIDRERLNEMAVFEDRSDSLTSTNT